jgi:signal transduction histidine kinase
MRGKIPLLATSGVAIYYLPELPRVKGGGSPFLKVLVSILSARRLTLLTFIGLLLAGLAVGGIAWVSLRNAIWHGSYSLQQANMDQYGRRFAAALETQIARGIDDERILEIFQSSLGLYPGSEDRYICLVASDGRVLCHPHGSAVGADISGLRLASVCGNVGGTYAEWHAAGRTEGLALGPDGRPNQLIRRIPVTGRPWDILVHTRLSALQAINDSLLSSLFWVLAPAGLAFVLTGTLVVGRIARRFEVRYQAAQAELEERVEQRTAELRATVAELTATRDALDLREKMALLGTLIAGIAHEIQNPLTAILLISSSLGDAEPDPDTREGFTRIQSCAQRCQQLVASLLAFARNDPPRRTPTALDDVVNTAIGFCSAQLRQRGVELIRELDPANPTLLLDPIQIEQVVLNLINNASQAVAGQAGPRRVRVATAVDGPVVRLTVEDNGPGIPPDMEAHLFEPFHTTKPAGEGTGLGLSLCRRFVEHHGGEITHRRGPMGGALFEVRLPLVPATSPASSSSEVALPAIVG